MGARIARRSLFAEYLVDVDDRISELSRKSVFMGGRDNDPAMTRLQGGGVIIKVDGYVPATHSNAFMAASLLTHLHKTLHNHRSPNLSWPGCCAGHP